MKKVVINYNENHDVNIECDLEGQELYEVYVAFTVYMGAKLNNFKDIESVAGIAASDALNILKSNFNNMKN